jgi:DNA (cytosine-5)-methyltransferase 1
MPTQKNNIVPLRKPKPNRSIELFSGCGGLAMGLSEAGFFHEVLVERDGDACATLQHNRAQKARHAKHWQVRSSDVRRVNWSQYADDLTLVAGGPPCQPFSMGGKAAGNEDERDMWPEAVRAVRETLPKAFLFENVKGLLRERFADYVAWIAACLAHPRVERRPQEDFMLHLARLRAAEEEALYEVQVVPVNAADFGAPQKRNRVLFIGFRKDLFPVMPSFPGATHSQERLVWDKWISGEYWERHGLPKPDETFIPRQEARMAVALASVGAPPLTKAWVTCRDALHGLGEPGTRHDIPNHRFQAGARTYPGHTGSPIDEPAKALKAGVHGVPGGENMLLREDGTVRYFSIREAARLQGFADDFEFPGSWTESMRQLGNAVPVTLARFVGDWIAATLASARVKTKAA